MKDISPVLLLVMGIVLGVIHLACGAAIATSLLRPGQGPGWSKVLWGVRGTSTAGFGLACVAVIVFLRERPDAVTAGDRWMMLTSLGIAVLGQFAVGASMISGDALRAPARGERRFPRLYALLAPLIAMGLLVILWFARGMH